MNKTFEMMIIERMQVLEKTVEELITEFEHFKDKLNQMGVFD